MKEKLVSYLEKYGKLGSWVKIYNQFPVRGNDLTNKQKSDYVRGVYRKMNTSSVLEGHPRIFVWDIETSPLNAYIWSLWNQNVSPTSGALQADWFIISWAGKELFKKKMYSGVLNSEEAIQQNDERIVRTLWEQLDKADIIIGHNIQKFDIKRVNTRFLYYGLGLPSPYQIIDTLLQAKKSFSITSNKLDYIAEFLGLGRKLKTSFALWDGCMKGDPKSLKKMDKYCITPDHKLLGNDLRWKEANQFKVGDKVLGFDEYPDAKNKRRGYKEAVIQKITYDIAPVFEVELTNGDKLKVTAEHRWLVRAGLSYKWLRTDQLRSFYKKDGTLGKVASRIPKLLNTWVEEKSYDIGYLAGIIDGEGTMDKRYRISSAQRPTMVLKKSLEILDSLWGYTVYDNDKHSDTKSVYIKGHKMERLRFLGTYRAERLIEKVNFNTLGKLESRVGDAHVLKIKKLGDKEIIKITTSTGTFICDGYPMHNCQQDIYVSEDVYLKLRPYMKSHPNLGLYIGDSVTACPSCLGKELEVIGTYKTKVSVYEALRCKSCNSISRSRKKINKSPNIIPS